MQIDVNRTAAELEGPLTVTAMCDRQVSAERGFSKSKHRAVRIDDHLERAAPPKMALKVSLAAYALGPTSIVRAILAPKNSRGRLSMGFTSIHTESYLTAG